MDKVYIVCVEGCSLVTSCHDIVGVFRDRDDAIAQIGSDQHDIMLGIDRGEFPEYSNAEGYTYLEESGDGYWCIKSKTSPECYIEYYIEELEVK